MSEYQYYEFRAIDRSLTDRQMHELRAISTRAAISRTSFSNHYEYGDLKANPRNLLVKYFDASLYFAHWMYLEVAFRFPKDAVDVKTLRRYAGGHTFDLRMMAGDVIVAISVESDGETFDAADDGSDWLSSVIGLRADIANGDQRAPYLAWLLDVQCGVVDDDAPEPARPEGLGALSPALESLVDVIGLDRDLVAVAAEGAPRAIAPPSSRDLHRWVSGLDGREHVALLTRVARGDGSVSAELLQRFRQQAPRQAAALPLRTAGELRVKAEAITRKRLDAAGQREARERARREREERASRERYLTGLARRERQAWERVDGLIGTKRPGDYAAAVTLLVDLRDISGRNRRDAAFAQRLATSERDTRRSPRYWLASQRQVCRLPSGLRRWCKTCLGFDSPGSGQATEVVEVSGGFWRQLCSAHDGNNWNRTRQLAKAEGLATCRSDWLGVRDGIRNWLVTAA